jgi:hypothetical protein
MDSQGSTVPRASADTALQVKGTPQVDESFGAEAVFSIDASSSAGNVTDVQLHYTLLPTGTANVAGATFDPGASVHAVYHMRTAGNPLYLPPMKQVSYFWTLSDSAGNQLQTDPVEWTYKDTRFPFKTASNGNLTLYYYAGSDANAQRVLGIGRAALDKAAALDGTSFDFPVKLVAYANQADVGPALEHSSKGSDPFVLGQSDPPDIVVLDIGNLTGSDNDDTVRHELTHIVNAHATASGGSGFAQMPIWLDEGLAVFSQQSPGGFDVTVQEAIRRDTVVPLTSLSESLRGSNAGLFYGEAWSVVHFLVSTYGPGKMAQILAEFKSGTGDDAAFTKAYGMDRTGIYNAWRKSVGLQQVAAPQPTSAAPSNSSRLQPAPTQPGAAPPNAQPTQPAEVPPKPAASSSSSSGTDTIAVVMIAVGGTAAFLALLVAAVLGGLALSRRGSR